MKPIKILSLILVISIVSCSKQNDDLDKYSWLLGNWKTTKGSTVYEYWKAENDTLYSGIGYRLYGTDTIIAENLKIVKREDRIIYYASVPDQNNGRTISFNLVSTTSDSIVFENPSHDFPNRITYLKKRKDKMKMVLTGFQKRKSIEVIMERIP